MAQPSAGRSFVGTFGLVVLAIAALFAVDTFLARIEQTDSRVEAARLFEQGQALMRRGENAGAIERIQDALSIERGNSSYMRALAQAQLANGKTDDAEATLTELLESDSTDGLANLIMARVLVKQSRFTRAISFFHRAIYGRWNDDAAQNRFRVRSELIDLLAQRNSKEELLAELLSVQDNSPLDLTARTRFGRLFLLAGSPARAADVFHGILHEDPANADAHAGLGQSDFERGDYRAAQRDFQAALRLAPDDEATQRRLEACNEVLRLNPTTRGLGPAERFRRSLQLVELTLDAARQCAGQNALPHSQGPDLQGPDLQGPDLQGLIDRGTGALKAHVGAARQSEVAESNLDLAEQLWQARRKECKPPPAADSPLALVLAKLAQ